MTKDDAFRVALETADGILNSDWRNWQELSSPEEFERWVKARANHMAIALRQALDQLPDTTKMIDTGIDRGAWSDVPDATKWVDELRGDDEEWTPDDMAYRPNGLSIEESPNSTTSAVEPVGEIVEAHGLIAVSIPNMPPVGMKLYTAPPQREWVGLTEDEMFSMWLTASTATVKNPSWSRHIRFWKAIEARLKEKNHE